jgi:hypothetical protein
MFLGIGNCIVVFQNGCWKNTLFFPVTMDGFYINVLKKSRFKSGAKKGKINITEQVKNLYFWVKFRLCAQFVDVPRFYHYG